MRSRFTSLREQHAARSTAELSDSLETGRHGLDNSCRSYRHTNSSRVFATLNVMILSATVFFGVCGAFSIRATRERAREKFENVQATLSESPCTHFTSDWFHIIALPKMRHGMATPKIMSVSATVVQSGEILELDGCVGKQIQRERFVTIGVKYQPLNSWPFGRSRDIALDGEQAVCVQHAVDQFAGKLTCNSV
jgi:hypothetical protein